MATEICQYRVQAGGDGAKSLDLFDYVVSDHQFDEATICEIIRQILSGLEATHKCKLAHFDLKLDQILVSADYKMKITDFGLAKSMIVDGKDQFLFVTKSLKDRNLETGSGDLYGLWAPELKQAQDHYRSGS